MLHEKNGKIGFFRPKCAKTRLEGSIISNFLRGLHPPTHVNKSSREGNGEATERGNENREPRTRGLKKVVRFFNGGGRSIASGGIDAPVCHSMR
jgi:hypothetical protein